MTLPTMTAALFRSDNTEFSNPARYPDNAINRYLAQGTVQLNSGRWGQLYNTGLELFISHHLMLWERRQATAALNGQPGLQKGNLGSESPGQIALSYDTQVSTEERGGFWNSTEYGIEFIRLARLVGMGPVSANVGTTGPAGQVNSFMAWPGPPTGNGYSF